MLTDSAVILDIMGFSEMASVISATGVLSLVLGTYILVTSPQLVSIDSSGTTAGVFYDTIKTANGKNYSVTSVVAHNCNFRHDWNTAHGEDKKMPHTLDDNCGVVQRVSIALVAFVLLTLILSISNVALKHDDRDRAVLRYYVRNAIQFVSVALAVGILGFFTNAFDAHDDVHANEIQSDNYTIGYVWGLIGITVIAWGIDLSMSRMSDDKESYVMQTLLGFS